MAFDRARFLKLVAMTTSAHDGEAMNALRMANKMLADAKLTWAEVMGAAPPPPPRSAPARHRPPAFNFGKHSGELVEDVYEDDPRYCEWLMDQTWFLERYPRHAAEIERLMEE